MTLPLYIAIIVTVIYVIVIFVFLFFRNEYREFKKDELQRQADESERPYVEPMYRRKYGKGKK